MEGIDTVLERCIETDRLEQGALAIEKEHHDVAQLLSDWVSSDTQQPRITLHLPAELSAHLDAPVLFMMVRNLLSNALSYSPEQSVVHLSLLARPACQAQPQPSFAIEVRNATGRAGQCA